MSANPVLDWLLQEGGPSIRYRTLTELIGEPQDAPAVQQARRAAVAGPDAARILARMHPDGYWLHRAGSGRRVGDGVEYAGSDTTHFCLAYLAELGLNRTDPPIALAADRYLGLQQPDGDFWQHLSCLYGHNVRTFVRLGYRGDPRLERSIRLMLATERPDGGYLCDPRQGRRVRRPEKSCLRGSGKVLAAFAELPDLHASPRCRALVDYFLSRGGIYRHDCPEVPVVPEATRTFYPFTWAFGLLEVLLALSTLGHGQRPELDRAWALLDAKRDERGRYLLDRTVSGAPFRAGTPGRANPWVTFYALLALRRRDAAAGPPASDRAAGRL